jgi:hypothetical protein
VSSFLVTLNVPWPHFFVSVMSRLTAINLNLMTLPKAACMTPSPSFYKSFNGYTLGLVCAMLAMGALWLVGSHVLAPLLLRGMEAAERQDRMSRFNSTVLTRTLLVLYIVYPGVSVAIVSMFSCSTLNSGRAFLNADLAIRCWDALHWRYVAGAIVWLFIVPIGGAPAACYASASARTDAPACVAPVPAFFIWLLYHFKVPQLALLKADNAWLREAAKKVWESGVEQPPANIGLLTVHSITDEHLELLVAVVLLDASVEEAADILSGKTSGLAFEEGKAAAEQARAAKKAAGEEPAAAPGIMTRLYTRVAEARASIRTFIAAKLLTAATLRISSSGGVAVDAQHRDGSLDRREQLLARLLLWCRTSGEVSLPVVCWDEEVEPEAAPADAAALAAVPEELTDTAVLLSSHFTLMRACSTRGKPASAAPADKYGGVHSREVNTLTERAAKDVGFLFAAYHCGCWYWEALELGRKLILTSVLALVQPGSATQVVVGLLISFLMLLLNLRKKPFHEDTLNFVNTIAQLNLFFLLFAALLLKVRVDGSGADSTFFTAIVGGMAIVPIALPISIKLFMSLGHSAHKEMRDVQERADEDF